MKNTEFFSQQVLGDSFVFSLAEDPRTKHIVPAHLREAVERAARGEAPSTLYRDLKRQNPNLHLREVAWVFDLLGRGSQSKSESFDFKKNWFDFEIFHFPLLQQGSFPKAQAAAWAIVFIMIVVSLTGPGGLFHLFEYAGFLQWRSGYSGSLWWLIGALTLLGFGKGLFRLLIGGLLTGKRPETQFCYRGLMFDLRVDATPVEVFASRSEKILYWVGSAYGSIATAAIVAWFVNGEQVRDLRLLALLLTLVSVNPSRIGEVSKLFSVLFPDSSNRRLMPFLKNRSLLFVLSREQKQEDEEKLILYSTISIAWTFSFLLVAQNILNSNFGEWWIRLTTSSPGEKLTVGVLALLQTALLVGLLYDLWLTIFRNLLFPRLSARLQAERERKMHEVSSYNTDRLISFLGGLPFFEGMSSDIIASVAKKGQVRKVPAGTRLILQGDEGNELFVLLEGEAEVLRRDSTGLEEHLAQLAPGSLFGEIALLRDVKRTADVRAVQDSLVFVLGKKEFKELIAGSSAHLLEQRVALSTFFADCPLFQKLPREALQLFLSRGEFVEAKKGTTVIREGDDDHDFYLLVRGRVRIESKGQLKGELETGGFFGEITIFENRPRTADVIAADDSLLLKISHESFWKVADQNLRMAVDLESVSEARMGA